MDDGGGRLAAANLPDDVIVEILSRLPVRALCRCKRVSRAWRDLISHHDHRRRLAQPLMGFFYHLHVDASSPPVPYWRFTAAAADPALQFLPPPAYSATDTELLDSCNGLLLLRCRRACASSSSVYVVCNPAAGNWVELPAPIHAPGAFGLRSDRLQGRRRTRLAALAFDPAVSTSRFHVLQLVEREEYPSFLWQYHFVIEAAEIYSSETKAWHLSVVSSQWSGRVNCAAHQAAYHDGSLHFAVDNDAVMSVDVDGDAWRLTRMLPVVSGGGRFLGRSRGRLLYVHRASSYASLSVYSLESRRGGAAEQWDWELKHYASPMDQFGKTLFKEHYGVVAVHPDGDVIFLFDACRGMMMAYDMGRRTVRDIQPLEEASRYYPFFPYVPMYSSEALSSG